MRKDQIADLSLMQNLVGNITYGNLKNVECYVSERLGIFIPSVGFCEYAITPRHMHPSYSFILFFSEEQSLVPVELKLSAQQYLCTAISPGIPHEEKETDCFTRYAAIFIDREFFEKIYSEYCGEAPGQYVWKQFAAEYEIMTFLKKFMEEFENRVTGYESMLEVLETVITHKLTRGLLTMEARPDLVTDKLEIQRIIEYIHQNFGEKLSISRISGMAGMSESHFIRTFKRETGLSPMEFLMKIRIEKAKRLLRSGEKSITEIAFQCGFGSTSHFSSSFVKHEGIKPSEYQSNYNK